MAEEENDERYDWVEDGQEGEDDDDMMDVS